MGPSSKRIPTSVSVGGPNQCNWFAFNAGGRIFFSNKREPYCDPDGAATYGPFNINVRRPFDNVQRAVHTC